MSYRMRGNMSLIARIAAVAVVLVIMFAPRFLMEQHTETFPGVVKEKDIVYNPNDEKATKREYRVTIQNIENDMVEVYVIRESLAHVSFNTATMYANLEVGNTYRFKVAGYRIGLLSLFQNIVEFEEVT